MRKLAVLLFLISCLQTAAAFSQTYTVASYNLRYDNPRDTGNEWSRRLPQVAALIRYHDFDLFGTQEGLYHQLVELDSLLPAYDWVGVGRNDSVKSGEFSAIFYRTDKFEVLRTGNFWLSPTPWKPGPGWDAHIPRICTWAELHDRKSRRRIFLFNAHFDHQGVQARNESSRLILQKIDSMAGSAPVIFTGDLNTHQSEESYLTLKRSPLLEDSYDGVQSPYMPNGTFNGFDIERKTPERIDHIFISKHFRVERWGVLTDSYGGRYPSDHFPVATRVILK